jgi:large subunit ribosomal protein L1
MNEKILEIVKKVREAKKRNFKQTFDLAINLKGLDLKKSENKIKSEITLPHGLGKAAKIGLIVDMLIPKAKELENIVLIKKDEVEELGRNKKLAKKFAKECKSFVAEAPLMPLVGKFLGQVLAVRNKMPTPIPPTLQDLKPVIQKRLNIVKIALKDSPVIHLPVGSEEMKDEHIAENIETTINSVTGILPKGRDNIKNFYLKLTMGKGVKFNL